MPSRIERSFYLLGNITMVSKAVSRFFIFLSTLVVGGAVALAQVCPPQGPEIIVTGGFYPVQWNLPYPTQWRAMDPLFPILPAYNPVQAWQDDQASFIQVSTLENPAAKLKIGPNMMAHLNARHLYNSPGNGSKFNQKYSQPIHLLGVIAYTVTHSVPVSNPNSPRVLRYAAQFPDGVGTSYGLPTNLVTVYAYNTGSYEGGMPVYIVTNMHPGDRS